MAVAQGVPARTAFTARLLENGQPVNGSVTLVARLFDAATQGAQVWTETFATVDVQNGVLHLELGNTAPLDATVLTGQPLWDPSIRFLTAVPPT